MAALDGLSLEDMLAGKKRKVFSVPGTPGTGGEWSQLAELILDAEIRDEVFNLNQEAAWTEARKKRENSSLPLLDPEVENQIPDFKSRNNILRLAGNLGTDLETLDGIKSLTPQAEWESRKMERVVRLEKIRGVLNDWQELEFLAVQKIKDNINNGLTKDDATLLAIANMAIRTGQMEKSRLVVSQQNSNTMIGISIESNQSVPMGSLPGPGQVGTVNLTLSHRVFKQIEGTVDKERGSFLDSISMLTASEVPELLIEGEAIEPDQTQNKEVESND